MATRLELLRRSISSMTMEEKVNIIKDVRESRRMSKQPIIKERKAREAKSTVDKMLDKMSPSEREALMQLLGVSAKQEEETPDETGS